jgi:hypothetical protein
MRAVAHILALDSLEYYSFDWKAMRSSRVERAAVLRMQTSGLCGDADINIHAECLPVSIRWKSTHRSHAEVFAAS